MAHADFVGVESIDRSGYKFNQFQTRGDESRGFSNTCAYLLNAVLRLLQRQKSRKTFGLFHRVNLGANQVLDKLRLQYFGVAHLLDAHRHGDGFGHLRGAIPPRSGHDLEAVFSQWPDEQGRKHTLAANAGGKFSKTNLVKDATGIGLRFVEQCERKLAVFGGIDNSRFHDSLLLSSG
jgi:hypothetical protein